MTLFGGVISDTLLDRQIILAGEQFRKGVTAPTDVTIGTTPTIPAQRFAATNELASLFEVLPFNIDLTENLELILIWSLVSGQINNDTLDVTMDYTVPILNSTGNGIAKASTQLLATTTVTTGNGLAAGDMYSMLFLMLAGDATNPLANAAGLALEIHLTNTTGVASADLVAACLNYKALY